MEKMLNKYEALRNVIDYLELDAENSRFFSIELEGNVYELQLRGEWMKYDCFVDALTGDVLGLDCEPYIDFEDYDGIACSEILNGEQEAA